MHNLHFESTGPLQLTSARLADPVFPTAKSVTVARIASPHSVNRAYQPLFLEGLKQYFQSHRRILKQGDLIAVGICEENVRFIDLKGEEDEIE
jgi:peroxin-6